MVAARRRASCQHSLKRPRLAHAHLSDLEAAYTIEKAKMNSLQARLFSRLRQHHQEREWLRLIASYRRQFLDTLLRQGEEIEAFGPGALLDHLFVALYDYAWFVGS